MRERDTDIDYDRCGGKYTSVQVSNEYGVKLLTLMEELVPSLDKISPTPL